MVVFLAFVLLLETLGTDLTLYFVVHQLFGFNFLQFELMFQHLTFFPQLLIHESIIIMRLFYTLWLLPITGIHSYPLLHAETGNPVYIIIKKSWHHNMDNNLNPILKLNMIKVQSGYYYFQEDKQTKPDNNTKQQPSNQSNVQLEVVGDVKGYLKNVAQEVKRIKELRKKSKQEQMKNRLILEGLGGSQGEQEGKVSELRLEISVPTEVYDLEQRISKLEQKISNDEIVRQKIQRKGKLAERAKLLNAKIQKLSQKSVETISANIQSYFKTLDEREQHSKALFLYEAFTKTNTLSDQIETLATYLQNLSVIQTKLKALPPQKIIIDNHDKLLTTREQNRQKIEQLAAYMTQEYSQLLKQIDSI